MGWARLDDLYDDHPKIKAITKRTTSGAIIHSHGITYCCRHENNGVLDELWLEEKVPQKIRREKALKALVELRLVDVIPKGKALKFRDAKGFIVKLGPFSSEKYRIHDFLDWNPSSKQLETVRAAWAEQKAEQRSRAKLEQVSAKSLKGVSKESLKSLKRVREVSADPIPSHPIPSNIEEDKSSSSKNTDPAVVYDFCCLLADLILERDPKAKTNPDSDRWQTSMRLLLNDRDGDLGEVERVLRWSQADSFWQRNILSPTKLREKFTQLKIGSEATSQKAAAQVDPRDAERLASLDRMQGRA